MKQAVRERCVSRDPPLISHLSLYSQSLPTRLLFRPSKVHRNNRLLGLALHDKTNATVCCLLRELIDEVIYEHIQLFLPGLAVFFWEVHNNIVMCDVA